MANFEHQRKYLQEYNEHNKKFKTNEEINYLCNLYSLGLNSRELAKLFNCSVTQKVIGLDRVIRAIEERHGIK